MGETIATNKKAYHDYFVEDTYECGVVLVGSEVKSIRLGNVNLRDSYASVKNGEVFMVGVNISPYDKGSFYNLDTRRARKLLLKKAEIRRMCDKVAQKGYTLVPLKLYFKQALVKVELGVCKGKATYDKRETLKQKDIARELDRAKKDFG